MTGQLAERHTGLGDKIEIYFDAIADTMPFTVVFNDTTSFPCISWHEAFEMYEHPYVLGKITVAA